LRVRIARGRSYTSVLVIPRRKMSLCEAHHGRRPWPDLNLHESSWELTGEGKEKGKERRGTRGAARGRPWALQGLLCSVREGNSGERKEKEKERRRKERRKRKKEGKKEKSMNFFQT
jgi:hypothetical protein